MTAAKKLFGMFIALSMFFIFLETTFGMSHLEFLVEDTRWTCVQIEVGYNAFPDGTYQNTVVTDSSGKLSDEIICPLLPKDNRNRYNKVLYAVLLSNGADINIDSYDWGQLKKESDGNYYYEIHISVLRSLWSQDNIQPYYHEIRKRREILEQASLERIELQNYSATLYHQHFSLTAR